MDCIFCAIVSGEAESSRVYNDETTLAFLDIQPVTPGHLLVVPKRHAASLEDLTPDEGAAMFRTAHYLAGVLRRADLRCDGVNLFLADGQAASQEVFHTHLHVFPRFTGDGFRIESDWQQRPRTELDAVADKIKAARATY